MRAVILFAAGLFVGLAVHVGLAQNAGSGVVMMNHVCINVPNIDEAVKHYSEKMGYKEAFRVNDDKGQVRLVYMQITRTRSSSCNRPTPSVPRASTITGSRSRTLPTRSPHSRRPASP